MSIKSEMGLTPDGEVIAGRVVDRFNGNAAIVVPAAPADNPGRKMDAVTVTPLPPPTPSAERAARLLRELDRIEAEREREATRWERHPKIY